MELWVIVSISAAFFQTIRTAVQKHMVLGLSTNAVTFVRFLYGFPWACAYIVILLQVLDLPLPSASTEFWVFCAIAGIAQIIATSLLIKLFSFRNFMVGTTYAKTEAIQTAVLGSLFFNDALSTWGFLAVLIGIFGVMLIAATKGNNRPVLWREFRFSLLVFEKGFFVS